LLVEYAVKSLFAQERQRVWEVCMDAAEVLPGRQWPS